MGAGISIKTRSRTAGREPNPGGPQLRGRWNPTSTWRMQRVTRRPQPLVSAAVGARFRAAPPLPPRTKGRSGPSMNRMARLRRDENVPDVSVALPRPPVRGPRDGRDDPATRRTRRPALDGANSARPHSSRPSDRTIGLRAVAAKARMPLRPIRMKARRLPEPRTIAGQHEGRLSPAVRPSEPGQDAHAFDVWRAGTRPPSERVLEVVDPRRLPVEDHAGRVEPNPDRAQRCRCKPP